MRRLPGVSPMGLTLVLTGGFFVVVLVVTLILTLSGGNDAQTASNTTPSSEGKPFKVVITGTEGAKEEVTDGGIAGLGIFKASGAITDRGTVTTYRGADRCEGLGDLASARHEGQRGRDHLHGEDRHDTEAGQTAMVDSVWDRGVQGASGQGRRVRGRDLHRQHANGKGLALAAQAVRDDLYESISLDPLVAC